jgi:hypothetical protein
MEEFKSYDSLLDPDERNSYWCIEDTSSGVTRSLSLEDVYNSISEISLDAVIPEDIKSQFNVAKNVAAYSWFCYPFHQVCEMKVYATVECALKQRLGKEWPFPKLIKKAINWGLITDKGFSHIAEPEDEASVEYSKSLVEIMPELRNGLAHGGTTLHPGAVSTLKICADFINQLYRNEINNEMYATST